MAAASPYLAVVGRCGGGCGGLNGGTRDEGREWVPALVCPDPTRSDLQANGKVLGKANL